MTTFNLTTGSVSPGIFTLARFCEWAAIGVAEAETEIMTGRLCCDMTDGDLVIDVNEACRWIKAKHGVNTPFRWWPAPSCNTKVNPFADAEMLSPEPLSTIIL